MMRVLWNSYSKYEKLLGCRVKVEDTKQNKQFELQAYTNVDKVKDEQKEGKHDSLELPVPVSCYETSERKESHTDPQ